MFRHFVGNMIQLLLSPAHGWEDVGKNAYQPSSELYRGYLPLILITALSSLLSLVYHRDLSVVIEIIYAVIIYLMFFLGYFIGIFTLSIVLPGCVRGKVDYHRGQLFVIYTLGLLALNSLLVNVLPMTAVLLFFMPIYVALIMWKGVKFLNIGQKRYGDFMLAAIFGVLVPPYIIYFVFNLLLP